MAVWSSSPRLQQACSETHAEELPLYVSARARYATAANIVIRIMVQHCFQDCSIAAAHNVQREICKTPYVAKDVDSLQCMMLLTSYVV